MKYNEFLIEQDKTGYAKKYDQFAIFDCDWETFITTAGTIEECKNIIDEILNETL